MLSNIIIILLIILAVLGIVIFYKNKLESQVEDEEKENVYSLSYLTSAVAQAFADTQKENLKEMNLSKNELEAEQRKKHELRQALKNAAYGDANAKNYVESFIKSILQDEAYGVDTQTIDQIIPFNNPRMMSVREKVDVVLYLYAKQYGSAGFERMMIDNGLNLPKPVTMEEERQGAMKYDVTAEDMDRIFMDLAGKHALSYADKLQIVTERIFADYKGFGVIEPLFYFSIDEIEGGVGGIAKTFVDDAQAASGKIPYSYEYVSVVFKGINMRLSCMSFGSQAELIRICRNIYKFQTSSALTRNNGHVVATMKDGSRVSVSRPPEAGSWSFCVRKFDTVSTTPTPEELLKGQERNMIPIVLTKWIMYTQRSVFVTGGMGTGKTTWLKSVIGYIPSEKNLRVYELSPELNLQKSFPFRNIASFSVTESTTMQDLYDFGKKFNANVNIIGETASAAMGVITVESARVGSEQALSTHHATTTENLVTAIRDNLTSAGGYSDEAAAEEVVINAFNFDIHMGRIGKTRFVERITEIVPIRDRRYPSEIAGSDQATARDTLENYKRMTDRKSYRTVNICEFDPKTNSYVMKNMISDELMEIMYNKLDERNQAAFVHDMNLLSQIQ